MHLSFQDKDYDGKVADEKKLWINPILIIKGRKVTSVSRIDSAKSSEDLLMSSITIKNPMLLKIERVKGENYSETIRKAMPKAKKVLDDVHFSCNAVSYDRQPVSGNL